MKNSITILYLVVLLIGSTNAQNSKKGYKNLEKREFLKAKEMFAKALLENEEDVASNFGMALILADDSSGYFNIIDAWSYVEKTEGKINLLSQEDIETIGSYFMNTEIRKTSRPVKQKIRIAIEAIEDRLIKYIREENDLDACNEVLERYPDFKHYDNVVHIRNQFVFREYEKMNTLEGYAEFLEKYPESAQVERAIRNRNKLAFTEAKAKNTSQAYNTYITGFPDSEYRQTAIKLRNASAYFDAVSANTLEAFNLFVDTYPDALEVVEAKVRQRELLYQKAKTIKTLEAYNKFIKKYPGGTYYLDIFKLKSMDLGAIYAQEYNLQTTSVEWVRAFDNNGHLEDIASLTKTNDGGFVLVANTRMNDSAFSDTWVLKVDGQGEMLWNKIIGQKFEDNALAVHTTSNDEIIVVGYTYLNADSSSRMGWMFKLGNDGKKIWNKNLGKVEISASALDHNDNIFLSTKNMLDTLKSGYYLESFSSDGIKDWERKYTLKGNFNDIQFRTDNSALLCGSNWIVSVDDKKYIQWEDSIPQAFTGKFAAANENGSNFILFEDSSSVYYQGYGSTGNKLWKKSKLKTNPDHVQMACETSNFNDVLICEQTNNNQSVIKNIDALTGNEKSVKEIPQKLNITACKNQKGCFAIVIAKLDVVLVNYNTIGF